MKTVVYRLNGYPEKMMKNITGTFGQIGFFVRDGWTRYFSPEDQTYLFSTRICPQQHRIDVSGNDDVQKAFQLAGYRKILEHN